MGDWYFGEGGEVAVTRSTKGGFAVCRIESEGGEENGSGVIHVNPEGVRVQDTEDLFEVVQKEVVRLQGGPLVNNR